MSKQKELSGSEVLVSEIEKYFNKKWYEFWK